MVLAHSSISEAYFAWYAARFRLKDTDARDLLDVGQDQVLLSDFPRSIGHPYFLEVTAPGHFLGPAYSGILNGLKDLGYVSIVKVSDTLTAGAFTAPFAAGRQALEERLAQSLPKVQEMIAGTHELMRDIEDAEHALQELLESEQPGSVGEQAELALKGRWLDEVEGGAGNLSSVIGLAQRSDLAELPGLFFSLRRKPLHESDDPKQITSMNAQLAEVVETLTAGPVLKRTLLQKLLRYAIWKDGLRRSLLGRRVVLVARLRGQYQSLQLQVSLLRPVLRHLRQYRTADEVKEHPELAALFGNVVSEVELLASKRVAPKSPLAVVSVAMKFVLRPSQPEQRGVPPTASLIIQYRAYAWDEESVKRYLYYRSNEDLDYLVQAGESIFSQLAGIQTDINRYLAEGSQTTGAKSPVSTENQRSEGILAPLTYVFSGIADAARWTIALLRSPEASSARLEGEIRKAARRDAFLCYKMFKASHGLLTW